MTATAIATHRSQGVAEAGRGALRTASRVTYTTTYVLTYGVVFLALLVGKALPLDNPVGHGMIDGGRAARDAVKGA